MGYLATLITLIIMAKVTCYIVYVRHCSKLSIQMNTFSPRGEVLK